MTPVLFAFTLTGLYAALHAVVYAYIRLTEKGN